MIQQSLSHLDALIAEKSLLKHPFYVKWSKGELTRDHMKVYAKEYFHLAKSVPGVVSRIMDRVPADNAAMKSHIEKNMQEEQEHVELWKRFAKSLGITDAELEAYEPTETVRNAVADLEKLAEQSYEDGVAAMYAFECELPKIAETKKDGLSAFYGLTSEDAHIYFDEHLGEEEHLKVWRNVAMDGERATLTASRSLDAQNRVLDGVCEAAGICTTC